VVTRVATPEFIRSHFRVGPADKHPALKQHAWVGLLLGYCSQDLREATLRALHALPLLPAADGRSVQTFLLYQVGTPHPTAL
jgi:hypothetical protein